LFAINLSVAEVTGWAETLGLVVNRAADGVDSASSGFETRQDAAVVLAALFHVAIAVAFAFVLLATDSRISGVAVGAEANCSVVRDSTFRSFSARADLTRIFTLSVNASLLDGAIGVGFASGGAASESAELTSWALVVRRALETTTSLDAGFTATAIVDLRAGFRAQTGNASS
jgi:hypothetical protein